MLETKYGYGSWKITPEIINGIQNHNMEDIALFCEQNKQLIDSYARKYEKYKSGSDYGYNIEDMKQQLYLDLPYLTFGNAGEIVSSLRRSFYYSALGGLSWLKENHRNALEQKHFTKVNNICETATNEDGEEYSMLDLYASEPSPETRFLQRSRVNIGAFVELLRPYLSPRVSQYLHLKLWGYGTRETLRKMGVKVTSTGYQKRLRYAAAEHYDEILKYLDEHESDYIREFERLGTELLSEIRKAKQRDHQKALKQQQAQRAKLKGTEAYKAKNKARNSTPERKAYMQEYRKKRKALLQAKISTVQP